LSIISAVLVKIQGGHIRYANNGRKQEQPTDSRLTNAFIVARCHPIHRTDAYLHIPARKLEVEGAGRWNI
jgi:hypothetical protein